MNLSKLRKKLEGVTGWLVDAENAFTHAGDMTEFDQLHDSLDDMLKVVIDLQSDIDEGNPPIVGSQT